MGLQFQHIVVLMLKNRSFDHLFGYYSAPPSGRGRGAGVRECEGDIDQR